MHQAHGLRLTCSSLTYKQLSHFAPLTFRTTLPFVQALNQAATLTLDVGIVAVYTTSIEPSTRKHTAEAPRRPLPPRTPPATYNHLLAYQHKRNLPRSWRFASVRQSQVVLFQLQIPSSHPYRDCQGGRPVALHLTSAKGRNPGPPPWQLPPTAHTASSLSPLAWRSAGR
jgi:hypothetical protein